MPKGTYILTGFVRFPKNSNGVRRANFNISSGNTAIQTLVKANGETYDQLNFSNCVKIDEPSSIMYLNAYQDSGESLTTISGGTFMRAIKIG